MRDTIIRITPKDVKSLDLSDTASDLQGVHL